MVVPYAAVMAVPSGASIVTPFSVTVAAAVVTIASYALVTPSAMDTG